MNIDTIIELEKKYRHASAEEIIDKAIELYGDNLAFATSLAWEDQAVTKLILEKTKNVKIFTLDTGRLSQETYDTIDATEKYFGIKIIKLFPDNKQVEEMINIKGVNSFYESIENRKECCNIRKTLPMQKFLSDKSAWITGLRREQSVTRFGMKKIEWDEKNGIVKFNPIADWTENETIEFVKKTKIPYNSLQDIGFRSLGCLPCTKAVGENDDLRAGRWWWESPESKECGLHK